MHVYLVLLFFSALTVSDSSAIPQKRDFIKKETTFIQMLSELTLAHIKKLKIQWEEAPKINVSTEVPAINGLTGAIHYLLLLEKELKSFPKHFQEQIEADVSSLRGRTQYFAEIMECSVREHAEAQAVNSWRETRFYVTLAKVQLYLERFKLNKDKLEFC